MIFKILDCLVTDDKSIMHVYAREITRLLKEWKCSAPVIKRRCESSDILIECGYTPSEALFLMQWTNVKKSWINSGYNLMSMERQFEWFYRVMSNITNDEEDEHGIYTLIRIIQNCEKIDNIYHSWKWNDCLWNMMEVVQELIFNPVQSQISSLKSLCVKQCVVTGIKLDGPYAQYKDQDVYWDKYDGKRVYHRIHEEHFLFDEEEDDDSVIDPTDQWALNLTDEDE